MFKKDKKQLPLPFPSEEDKRGPKTMSFQEFHEVGFLQEINRRILHPCGLALAFHAEIDENGEHRYTGDVSIVDVRHDPEGMVFGIDATNAETMRGRAQRVRQLMQSRCAVRAEMEGRAISGLDGVQRIPGLRD